MWKQLALVGLLAAALAALSGCSMSLVQRVLIPGGGFTLESDVAYGPEPRQKLDIYTPRGAAPRATVIFIYGGSWKSGTKELYRFLGQALTGRGYQVVVADYLLYPQVRYPAFVEDTALAVAWTKANIGARAGRPDRIVLMGHSAGAYNAVMVAIDPRWLKPHGLTPADLTAVVSLAGPLSFNPLKTESTRDIFATATDIDAARPVKLAAAGAAGAPPFLFVHGQADGTVNAENASNMATAVNDGGGRAALKLYAGVSHLGVVACFAWPLRWRAPCLDDVDMFMTDTLKARAGAVLETTQ
jgi:acetyl esterase/lipase